MAYHHTLPEGTMLNEIYRIERLLGSGGFANTYLAFEAGLDRRVAIKEYFPSELVIRQDGLRVEVKTSEHQKDYQWALGRFVEEARTVRKFNRSPSIVRVFRTFDAHNTAYIVLEYIDGPDLELWLQSAKEPPTQDELDRIAEAMTDALELVHGEGILHRDLKPKNIMLRDHDKSPVLIDFGAAKYTTTATVSRTTHAIVSHGYSPQEAYVATTRQQGPWTDIYGLAATLYRCIDGKAPLGSADRALNDTLTPAVDLPGARERYRLPFLDAIDWGLGVRPSERPRSIAEWRPHLLDKTKTIPSRPRTTQSARGVPLVWEPNPSLASVPDSGRAASIPGARGSIPASIPASSPAIGAGASRSLSLLAGVGVGVLLFGGGLTIGAMHLMQREPEPKSAGAPPTPGTSGAGGIGTAPGTSGTSGPTPGSQVPPATPASTAPQGPSQAEIEERERQRQAAIAKQKADDAERERQRLAAIAKQKADDEAAAERERQRLAAIAKQKADDEAAAERERQRLAAIAKQKADDEAAAERERQRLAAIAKQKADDEAAERERQRLAAIAKQKADAERERQIAANIPRVPPPPPVSNPSARDAVAPTPQPLRPPVQANWANRGLPALATNIRYSAAALSPDSRLLAAGGSNGAVRVWDAATAGDIATRAAPPSSPQRRPRVTEIAFGPSGSQLVAWSREDGEITLWEAGAPQPVATLAPTSETRQRVAALSFDPQGQRFVAVTYARRRDGTIRTVLEAWSINGQPEPIQDLETNGRFPAAATFARNGNFLVLALTSPQTQSHEVLLLDVRKQGAPLARLPVKAWPRAVALTDDASLLAIGGQAPTVDLWRLTSLAQPQRSPDVSLAEQGQAAVPAVRSLAFSPDGTRLSVAGEDDQISLWTISSAGGQRAGTPIADAADASWMIFLPRDGQPASLAYPEAGGRIQLFE